MEKRTDVGILFKVVEGLVPAKPASNYLLQVLIETGSSLHSKLEYWIYSQQQKVTRFPNFMSNIFQMQLENENIS